MGNNESVTAGNKAQADAAACDWYKLLALTGEGKNRLPGQRAGRKNIIPLTYCVDFFHSFCHYYESPIAFSRFPDTNYKLPVSSMFGFRLMFTNRFLSLYKNTVQPHLMCYCNVLNIS